MASRKHKKPGLRIGNYRITPLGLVTLGVLLLILIIAIVMVVFNPLDSEGGLFARPTPTPTPVPTIDPASITPTPSPSPTPSPTPEPEPRTARIRALGEIAMQQNLLKAATTDGGSTFDFSEMFSLVSDIMGDADYTIADVEGTLGGTQKVSGGDKMYTPPILIQNLMDCGVDMLDLANDHGLDGNFDELKATIANCQSAGMEYVGAATTKEEKNTPKIVDINGIKVGFVAYTASLNVREKKVEKNALKYGLNLVTKSNAKGDIQAARDAGADIVVCLMSWGKMLKRDVTDDQKKIADVLAKAGVDVIIGYGPHMVQPASWLEGGTDSEGNVHRTLVMSATGNFLSDQRDQYADSGLIFEFTITETAPGSGKYAIANPVYIPTWVWRASGEADGSYSYHTVACGQYLESEPEGMSYNDATRMREVWAEVQSSVGTGVATVQAE